MLTSIVMLTLNNMDQTVACIHSIRAFSDSPYELIVVDNGSTDGTVGWLYEQPDVRLIRNGTNVGFAAACNQGMAVARGDVFLLLNNDTLVSPRWLSQLLAALLSDSSVGIVGPVSNFVLPMQKLPESYGSPEQFFRFADGFNRHDPSRWRVATALSGFCMMFRRSTWERLGNLDEQFNVGGYEDIDYGYRAMKAGLSLRIAGDTFIHHEGNRSFNANHYDMYAIAGVNRRKYIRKWGYNPERLILQLDPGFLPGIRMQAHPHHEPDPFAIPSGWYGTAANGCVYRVERGVKRPIASYDDLLRLNLSMDRVALGAHDLLAGLPEGIPIRPLSGMLKDYPDVFIASDPYGGFHSIAYGIRYPFRDMGSIRALGLRYEDAVPLGLEQIHSLPEGWPIQGDAWEEHELMDHVLYAGPDGAFYYGEGQRLRRIVSSGAFGRYGWRPEKAVPLPPHVLHRSPRGADIA